MLCREYRNIEQRTQRPISASINGDEKWRATIPFDSAAFTQQLR